MERDEEVETLGIWRLVIVATTMTIRKILMMTLMMVSVKLEVVVVVMVGKNLLAVGVLISESLFEQENKWRTTTKVAGKFNSRKYISGIIIKLIINYC